MNELKIQISNFKELEKKLISLGGELYDTKTVIDTYFNIKNPNNVLKISEYNNKIYYLEKLRKNSNGSFEIISEYGIDDINKVKELKAKLELRYGIKCILNSERHYFIFSKFKVIINLIDNIGEFLILTGENISEQIITKTLRIKNPKFIRVPFSEIKPNNYSE